MCVLVDTIGDQYIKSGENRSGAGRVCTRISVPNEWHTIIGTPVSPGELRVSGDEKTSFSVGSVLDSLADAINRLLLLPISGSAERKNSDEVRESASLEGR